MNSEESMNIKIKEELDEEMTNDDNESELTDAFFSDETVKLENEVKKELPDEVFANEIDDNTKYLCELCNSYFPTLTFLRNHMQSHDNCDDKIDIKSSNDSVDFEETKCTEVKEASLKGNRREKPDDKQKEKCNEKKTKRKRQRTEEKDNGKNLKQDPKENFKFKLVNLIMKDHIVLGRKYHDGIVDKTSLRNVIEETEDINENDNDELLNLITKDHIILKTNHHDGKVIKIKTETSEETSRNPIYEKSNVHVETSDGNNEIDNELSEKKHDTVMEDIHDEYDNGNKENASKDSNNRKRTNKLVSIEHATENIPSQSQNMPNQKYVCNLCKKSYETRKKLKKHISNLHQRAIFCDVCLKKFSRKGYLDRHVKRVHLRTKETENIQLPSPNQEFVCNFCSRSYETSTQLQTHKYNSHTPTRLSASCDVCQKKFSRKEYLDQHVKRVHLRIKDEWKCKFCGNFYSDRGNLRRHIIFYCTNNKGIDKDMKPNTKVSCKICRKKYVSQEKFEMHMADHPKFICDYCDNIYYLRYVLETHIKRHHLNMRYRCKKCGNEYVTRHNLNKHMKRHPQCDKNISTTPIISNVACPLHLYI